MQLVKGVEDPEEIRLVLDRSHEGCRDRRLGPFLVNNAKAPDPVFPAGGNNAGNTQPVNGRRLPGVVIFNVWMLPHAA